MDDAVRKIRDFFTRIEGDGSISDSDIEPIEQIKHLLSVDRIDALSAITESQPNTAAKERPVPRIPLDKIKAPHDVPIKVEEIRLEPIASKPRVPID